MNPEASEFKPSVKIPAGNSNQPSVSSHVASSETAVKTTFTSNQQPGNPSSSTKPRNPKKNVRRKEKAAANASTTTNESESCGMESIGDSSTVNSQPTPSDATPKKKSSSQRRRPAKISAKLVGEENGNSSATASTLISNSTAEMPVVELAKPVKQVKPKQPKQQPKQSEQQSRQHSRQHSRQQPTLQSGEQSALPTTPSNAETAVNPKRGGKGRYRGRRKIREEEEHLEEDAMSVTSTASTFSTLTTASSLSTSTSDLPLRERLEAEMMRKRYHCPVCMESIVKSHKIWSCPCCYAIIHIHCMKQWMFSNLDAVTKDSLPKQAKDVGSMLLLLFIFLYFFLYCYYS